MRKLSSALVLCALTFAFSPHATSQVIISEFMADNTRTLADEDGAYEDWIEIYNTGAGAVNMDGWYLTDDASDLTGWRFPSTNLNAGSFLVVFASGKNRRQVSAAGTRCLVRFRPGHDQHRFDHHQRRSSGLHPNGGQSWPELDAAGFR